MAQTELLDEKIRQAKRQALVLFLEGEYWRKTTYEKWEAYYLKSLLEEQEKQVQRKEQDK